MAAPTVAVVSDTFWADDKQARFGNAIGTPDCWLEWDTAGQSLSGSYHRMPGISAKAFFYLPAGWYPKFDFPLSPGSARLTHVDGPVWMQEFTFAGNNFDWTIPFDAPKAPPAKEPTGSGMNP